MDVRIKAARLHPGQRYVRANKRRFNALCCGRRWGKTHFGLDELVFEKGGALDGLPVGWFAPTYKMLLEPWRDAKRILKPLIRKGGISEQEKRIELITGGALDFWSLSDPDNVRGRKYGRIAVDEAAMIRKLKSTWQQVLRPLLTDYRGGAWLLTTPKGRNDFAELFDEAGSRNNWARFQRPTSDNPFIDPAELEEAREDLPMLVYAQEYLAQFVDMAGNAVKREWLRYGDPFERWHRSQLVIVIGVDLAISLKETADYTAFVTVALDPDGGVWVLDAYRERLSMRGMIKILTGIAEKWSPNAIAVENVQYQAAAVDELLRTTTLPVRGVFPEKDKLTRFQPLIARYEHGLVTHSTSLPAYFEYEILSFPPASADDHDDLVDAFGHAYAEAHRVGFGQIVDSAGSRITAESGSIRENEESGWGTVSVTAQRGY